MQDAYCSRCARPVIHDSRFCSYCRTPVNHSENFAQPMVHPVQSNRRQNWIAIAGAFLVPSFVIAAMVLVPRLKHLQPSAPKPLVTVSPSPVATAKAKRVVTPRIDLKKLAGQPASVVEKRLGAAITVDEITDDPREMPGDFREYRVKGFKTTGETEAGFLIRFHNDRAVSFIVEFDVGITTAEDALLLVGVDVHDKEPSRNAMFAKVWEDLDLAGIHFKNIGAQTDLDGKAFIRVIANL